MGKIKLICKECFKEFYSWSSQKRKFCSNICRLKSLHRTTPEKRKTGQIKKCIECDKEYYVQKWKEKVDKGKFCSRKCYAKNKSKKFTGKGNPQYIDGRVKKYAKSFYLSKEWRKLRKEIYKRDNYTCQECGKKGGRLHAHHRIPVGICKDPFDKDNIITLCHSCHCKTQRR